MRHGKNGSFQFDYCRQLCNHPRNTCITYREYPLNFLPKICSEFEPLPKPECKIVDNE